MKRPFKIILSVLAMIVGTMAMAYSQNIESKFSKISSVDSARSLMVLEDGRIKPLDTYARSLLTQFSGRSRFEKKSALDWFLKLILQPELTKEDKIFLINHPSIPEALGLSIEKKRRYSFAQVEPVYERLAELAVAAEQIEQKDRDIVEQEILRFHRNIKQYTLLSLIFSFAVPHSDFLVQENKNIEVLNLDPNQNQYSFIDMAMRAQSLHELTSVLQNKQMDEWTADQKELLMIISNLYQWSQSYRNLPLHLIPSYDMNDMNWLSPWDAVSQGLSQTEGQKEIMFLNNIANAYSKGHQVDFDLAVRGLKSSVTKRLEAKGKLRKLVVSLEVLFNKMNLLFYAKVLFLLTFFLFLIYQMASISVLKNVATGFVWIGCVLTAVAICIRMIILQRPPVSNLYETFVFVGFISVVMGLFVEKYHKQWLGIVLASVSGYVFLSIAGKFAVEGDTLQMLVAVLNSNFWLSTHVVSITMGYAGVCVAGIVGHVYIIQAITKPHSKKLLDKTFRVMLGTLGFGLIMSFLGTNLGGIWADQSWGRFWGWDPKENGALMIVLWTAMLFHLKIGRMVGPLGFAIGSVLGIIIVMWAWFGVNLLSVGLHSYGFTSGLAMNLIIYLILQILFLVICVPLARRKLYAK